MTTKTFRAVEAQISPDISATIRGLKSGESVYFDAAPGSVHAILSRIRDQYNGSRHYRGEREGGGIRVLRLK